MLICKKNVNKEIQAKMSMNLVTFENSNQSVETLDFVISLAKVMIKSFIESKWKTGYVKIIYKL